MKNTTNATNPTHQDADLDAAETHLPIADGYDGPLDSDDIDWLRASGARWLPNSSIDAEPRKDAA